MRDLSVCTHSSTWSTLPCSRFGRNHCRPWPPCISVDDTYKCHIGNSKCCPPLTCRRCKRTQQNFRSRSGGVGCVRAIILVCHISTCLCWCVSQSSKAALAPDAVEKGTPVSLQHVFQCKLMAFRRPYRKNVHFLHSHSPKQRHLISLGKVSVDNIKKNSWVVSKVDLREEIRPGDAVAVIPTDIKVLGSLDHHTYRVWWQTTQKNHFIDETFVYSANRYVVWCLWCL